MGGEGLSLVITDLSFRYPGSKSNVLDGIDLSISDREIFTLLGGSGSGKTTLLNVIAGFIKPLTGHIVLDGKDLTHERSEKRQIGIVFQDYALFPHMTVEGNVGFGPRAMGLSRKRVRSVTDDMLGLVGLEGYSARIPSELSGGEKQRVALARTLAVRPKVILLDEPLSALDTSLRESLRKDLKRILREQNIITLYITHDQSEALSISDRIGFLSEGRILEEGNPDQIYWRPTIKRTAEFMGLMNSIRIIKRNGSQLVSELGDIPWKGDNRPIDMMFRPESACMEKREGIEIKGRVKGSEYRGRDHLVDITSGKRSYRVLAPHDSVFMKGEKITVYVSFGSLVPIYR
ncbi:MAG: ABC transporter ATP-binding protein [Thermoplasmata archaeon]|nr:ABC transporter ATP-binding protein [Thermoplasmata archaeon]